MIPKIIHYCWIGGTPLPPLAEECIASWKVAMPDWEYMRWDETNFDIDAAPLYVRQAYEARKFAFVSDYVRLWALEQYGGLYMDVDFMVYKPFDELMERYAAFAGYEGSKYQPVMMGVIASEAHGAWVRDMLETYKDRKFILPDGRLDMTPNTQYYSDWLKAKGFVADGKEKDFYIRNLESSTLDAAHLDSSDLEGTFMLHVLPVWAFCPVLTTGENVRNEETYCEHKRLGSWMGKTWKDKLFAMLSPKWKTRIIKLKRKIFG